MMCPMARLTGDMQRLARYIADRRAELRLTQPQVSEAGGPSPATQSLFENGERGSMQATTAGDYEHALRWASGSIRRILAGREPVPLRTRLTRSSTEDDDGFYETVARIGAVTDRRRRLLDLIRASRLDPADDGEDSQGRPEAG